MFARSARWGLGAMPPGLASWRLGVAAPWKRKVAVGAFRPLAATKLGATFNAQDLWLMFFLLTGNGFSLILVPTLLGRIWCGYACPQTVLLEGLLRPYPQLFLRRSHGLACCRTCDVCGCPKEISKVLVDGAPDIGSVLRAAVDGLRR